jgi:thiol-disulfide isomerase/thioredoxin
MSQKSRYGLLIGAGLLGLTGVWIFRDTLRGKIAQSAAFANPAPPPELIEEVIETSSDRSASILSAWRTGKIAHREAAVREISRSFQAREPLPSKLRSILLTGALDPDMNVRETVLGVLEARNDPALPVLAAAQLRDPDPQLRLLGLNHLKHSDAKIGVPAVVPLLDEDDPMIVASALKLLEHWSGQNFGVKLADTAPFENPKSGLKEFREESRVSAQAGASRAKAWWTQHQVEFATVALEVPSESIHERRNVPAEDFTLRDLDDRKVRLSDLRGKIVLLNFWTTWCPACVSEMPELIVLQKKQKDDLVIIGVSLDFVPDSHGHIGGHAAVEEQAQQTEPEHKHDSVSLAKIKEKVARTVKARGVNYTILLDEKNEIGGRFNGGELPTTVIIDAEGNVRRRFIGARSLPVFESMLAEAKQPFAKMK